MKLPRWFVINVSNTVIQLKFSNWFNGQIRARDLKAKLKNKNVIMVDPEVNRAL